MAAKKPPKQTAQSPALVTQLRAIRAANDALLAAARRSEERIAELTTDVADLHRELLSRDAKLEVFAQHALTLASHVERLVRQKDQIAKAYLSALGSDVRGRR